MNPVPRRFAVVAVAVVVAAACTLAGLWQWQRHTTRSETIATIEANADAPPVPIEDVLGVARPLDDDDAWRPARVSGEYLPGATVELRNRPVGGRPAVGVLEVLSVTEGDLAGTALVVHRGWLSPDDLAAGVPAPPEGRVELTVRVRPGEAPSTASGRQVRAISVEQVIAAADADLTPLPGYGVLLDEDGSPPDGLQQVPLPELGFGSHLSYAFQWWLFAAGALVGAVVLIRRDAHADDAPAAPRRRRRPTAEEEEDAILDAARAPGRPQAD